MKKIEKKRGRFHIPGILFIFLIAVSCDNWLDVVPDNIPSLTDAFSNRASAERSLFSCYSYLPNPTICHDYPAYFTSYDEFNHGTSNWMRDVPAARILRGEQNTNSPIMNYWPGMFQAIRTCNIFLEGIDEPRDIEEEERSRWIAEAKFLKAYYHFWLVQLYGPVPLVKENIPLSADPSETRIFREPVDECIDYIVQLLDEAAPDLPLKIIDNLNEDGRITRSIALAVKAKAMVWRASPLFNGNTDYQNWVDSRNKQLISDTYSREKWEKAALSLREAIDVCHEAGHQLYRYERAKSPNTFRMNDSLVLTMNTRKAITERWNEGIVWSDMHSFSSGGLTGLAALNHFQNLLFPAMYPQDVQRTVGYSQASFEMSELFYTNNGVPIDEDIHWNYSARYQPKVSTLEDRNDHYIPLGQQTASLHFNREARFYANLGFDRGFFEISTTTEDGGATFTRYLTYRYGDFLPSGWYYVKKLIPFEASCSQGTDDRVFTPYDYRFPLIRLADLYLLYSEALNEVKNEPDAEVYEWIDKVREIVGLKGVVESWQNSRYPDRPYNKNEMRNIIRQERMIELAFEGQRFWDVRRWKIAEDVWNVKRRMFDNTAETVEGYYTPVPVPTNDDPRVITFKDYLWPISLGDLRINKNLVQTYGWD